MNNKLFRLQQCIMRYLNRKFKCFITIDVDLNKHDVWQECRSFNWVSGVLDDAFRKHLYTTDVGKWLLEHPWHVVDGVGFVSIAEFDYVRFNQLQFHFLKRSDAALFKLTFPS